MPPGPPERHLPGKQNTTQNEKASTFFKVKCPPTARSKGAAEREVGAPPASLILPIPIIV